MDKKELFEGMYKLTADPWTETEEEKVMTEKAFYEDLETGDVKCYIDCLKENRDVYADEDDAEMVEAYNNFIEEIRNYERI